VVGTLEATNYNLLPHEKAGIIWFIQIFT
jgi:hypothetical protein